MRSLAASPPQSRSPGMRPMIRPLRPIRIVVGCPRALKRGVTSSFASSRSGEVMPNSFWNARTAAAVSPMLTPTIASPWEPNSRWSASLAGNSRRHFGHQVVKKVRRTTFPLKSRRPMRFPSGSGRAKSGGSLPRSVRTTPMAARGSGGAPPRLEIGKSRTETASRVVNRITSLLPGSLCHPRVASSAQPGFSLAPASSSPAS